MVSNGGEYAQNIVDGFEENGAGGAVKSKPQTAGWRYLEFDAGEKTQEGKSNEEARDWRKGKEEYCKKRGGISASILGRGGAARCIKID